MHLCFCFQAILTEKDKKLSFRLFSKMLIFWVICRSYCFCAVIFWYICKNIKTNYNNNGFPLYCWDLTRIVWDNTIQKIIFPSLKSLEVLENLLSTWSAPPSKQYKGIQTSVWKHSYMIHYLGYSQQIQFKMFPCLFSFNPVTPSFLSPAPWNKHIIGNCYEK